MLVRYFLMMFNVDTLRTHIISVDKLRISTPLFLSHANQAIKSHDGQISILILQNGSVQQSCCSTTRRVQRLQFFCHSQVAHIISAPRASDTQGAKTYALDPSASCLPFMLWVQVSSSCRPPYERDILTGLNRGCQSRALEVSVSRVGGWQAWHTISVGLSASFSPLFPRTILSSRQSYVLVSTIPCSLLVYISYKQTLLHISLKNPSH